MNVVNNGKSESMFTFNHKKTIRNIQNVELCIMEDHFNFEILKSFVLYFSNITSENCK